MDHPFHFDLEKAIQAAAVILRKSPNGRMNYMKLLKLIAIAEREALKETGRMITGVKIVAMERGPVPVQIYRSIEGQRAKVERWEKFVRTDNYDVYLIKNPGVSKLSRFEIARLQEITDRHVHHDEWDMVEITHQHPEWQKNKVVRGDAVKMRPISLEDILQAVGRSDSKEIAEEALKQRGFADFFARHGACGKETPTQSRSPAII